MLIPGRAGTGGGAEKKGCLELGKGLVRDVRVLTPFSFFQALIRQQEPCFLSELLLYKERGCMRARILELPPALHPAGCAFPRHQGTPHGTPWTGVAPQTDLPCTRPVQHLMATRACPSSCCGLRKAPRRSSGVALGGCYLWSAARAKLRIFKQLPEGKIRVSKDPWLKLFINMRSGEI